MTQLRRFFLSSESAISEHDSPTGTWCRAAEALVIIEALQAEIADWRCVADEAAAKMKDAHARSAELKETLRVLSNGESWALRKAGEEMGVLQEKNAELEEKVAALQLDNATLAGLALDASNIFSYTEPGNAA